MGLCLGLLLSFASGQGHVAHAASLTPSEASELSQGLNQLQVSLNILQAAIQARSANELSSPNWVAIGVTLSQIRTSLGSIDASLASASGPVAVRPTPRPAPRPVPAPSVAPAPQTPPVADNPSPTVATPSNTGPGLDFSWGKALAALFILLAGAALIAFALREPRPRSEVVQKTTAARESEDVSGPGASPPPSGESPQHSPIP